MNPRIPTDLRNILATLYPNERSIRRVVDDAGVDSSKMDIDTHAMNSWHSVLSEAEKNHQTEAILKAVEFEYGNNRAFQAACHNYRQAISDSISKTHVSHPKTQNETHRQWLPASIIGLLLIGIVGGGLYWGIPDLRKLGMVTSTATVSASDGTEVPLTDTSSEVPATPAINTTVVTPTVLLPTSQARSVTEVKCGTIVASEFIKEQENRVYSLNMATQESFTVSVDTKVDYLYFNIGAYGPTGTQIFRTGSIGMNNVKNNVKNPTGSTGILTKGTYKIYVTNRGIGPYNLYIGCSTVNGVVIPGNIPQPTPTPVPLPTSTPRSHCQMKHQLLQA